jgi:hypothetical protein
MSLRKIKPAALMPLLFLASFLLPDGNHPAHADYYKYTDKTGAVCITNNPDAVPPKYRATMKVIREETLAKKDRESRIGTPAQPAAGVAPQEKNDVAPLEPASPLARLTSGAPWKKPALVAGAIVCLFLFVRKLSAILPSALLAKVIYLAFFLGTFVFLYKAYAEHVTNSFFTIKTKVIAMFEKSNRREAPDALEKQLQER